MENEIRVNVGHNFTIRLEAKPTAGYKWEIFCANESLFPVKLMDTYWTDDKSLVGAPRMQNFVFKALSVGSTTIAFRHRRSWEKDSCLEDREFNIQILD